MSASEVQGGREHELWMIAQSCNRMRDADCEVGRDGNVTAAVIAIRATLLENTVNALWVWWRVHW